MGVLTTQANTQHREMSGVTWRDIPITRININMKEQEQIRKQQGKRVTWNENLLDIKTISPRIKTDKFRFPAQQNPHNPPAPTSYASQASLAGIAGVSHQAGTQPSYSAALSFRRLFFMQ